MTRTRRILTLIGPAVAVTGTLPASVRFGSRAESATATVPTC